LENVGGEFVFSGDGFGEGPGSAVGGYSLTGSEIAQGDEQVIVRMNAENGRG